MLINFFFLCCLYSNGDGRTGVFLSLCLNIERLETEDNVDVFQTVRWLRSQRVGLVNTLVSELKSLCKIVFSSSCQTERKTSEMEENELMNDDPLHPAASEGRFPSSK